MDFERFQVPASAFPTSHSQPPNHPTTENPTPPNPTSPNLTQRHPPNMPHLPTPPCPCQTQSPSLAGSAGSWWRHPRPRTTGKPASTPEPTKPRSHGPICLYTYTLHTRIMIIHTTGNKTDRNLWILTEGGSPGRPFSLVLRNLARCITVAYGRACNNTNSPPLQINMEPIKRMSDSI